MTASATVAELERLIRRLQQERQDHQEAIAKIDNTFQQLGISVGSAPARRRPGRPPKNAASAPAAAAPVKKGRRGRKRGASKDGMTAEQFLVKLVSSDKLSTADINKRWTDSGRNGRADIMLGKLVAGGKLKRDKIKGERGSLYSAI